jgi:adenine-specific DNA-methyltransferase
MTTDPGDLVLDPTCGGGTTPIVAERWGRRWIAIDTARVPIALTRERLLGASYPRWRLREPAAGPAGGFECPELQRITLRTIAGAEQPETIMLVDRPTRDRGVRISGPFSLGGTGPAALWADSPKAQGLGERVAQVPDRPGGPPGASAGTAEAVRLLEFLRRSPVLRLPEGRTLSLAGLRECEGRFLHAEAEAAGQSVALSFGPESGAVTDEQVVGVLAEAHAYDTVCVVGFAFAPAAAQRAAATGVMLVHATADLLLGDLLKTTRASEIFAVTGLPDIAVDFLGDDRFAVRLAGVDVFDPVELRAVRLEGADVPAWFLDADFDGAIFRVGQAHFPRTRAFDALRRALGDSWDDSWGHATVSAPFQAGPHRTIAVKVVDERGHELVAVRQLPPDVRASALGARASSPLPLGQGS